MWLEYRSWRQRAHSVVQAGATIPQKLPFLFPWMKGSDRVNGAPTTNDYQAKKQNCRVAAISE